MKKDEPQKIRKRSDITPELIAKVQQCAVSGCTFAQTALITGYEEQSLRRWMAAYYNDGRAKASSRAGATLYNLAVGDDRKGMRPNLSALIFYLKCQCGWRETTGIVFESAQVTDENTKALLDTLERRFSRMAEFARKKEKAAQDEPQAAPLPPETGDAQQPLPG